jgi:acetyl-CoA C-acetyltransferase
MTTPVIIAAQRTPIATAHQEFATLEASDLAAVVWRHIRHQYPDAVPDDVILGMARGPGGNPARVSALAAGWPVTVPAVTIDRQCGAGLDAICLGAAAITSGSASIIAAGGAESASCAEPGRAHFAPAELGDPDMGPAADDLARRRGITRSRQDDYAALSHERAAFAQEHHVFDDEIVPVLTVHRDPRIKHRRREIFTRAPAVFTDEGTVTAANSCAVSDGAAGVLIVSEEDRARLGVPGLAITSWARCGVDPRWPGIGPTPAIREVIQRSGWRVEQIDRVEITEAFAAQVLAVLEDLDLADDDPRVCPDGGALAIGHPWGASGAVLVVRLFSALVRQGVGTRGLATCAIGGGQGIALAVEAVGP